MYDLAFVEIHTLMMESIVPECTKFKHQYDECFHEWFTERYIKGDRAQSSVCEELFKNYQQCIKPKLNGMLDDRL